MHDRLLEVFKKYNDAGLSFPTLFAILPLIVTALITTRVTYGDTTQAVYIIGELGLIQMWTQGIGFLIVTILPFLVGVLMLHSLKHGRRHWIMYLSALFLAVLVFFIANVIQIIFVIVLIYILDPIYDKILDKKLADGSAEFKTKLHNVSAELDKVETADELETAKKKVEALKKENEFLNKKFTNDIKALVFFLGCVILLQVVLSYPTIPRTTLDLSDGSSISGLVMKRDDTRVMIYDQDSEKVEMIYINNIKNEDVCGKLTSDLYGLGWSPARLTYEYIGLPTLPYEVCKE